MPDTRTDDKAVGTCCTPEAVTQKLDCCDPGTAGTPGCCVPAREADRACCGSASQDA